MSSADIETNNARSEELQLGTHFDMIGATNCIIARDDRIERRIPFFDHTKVATTFEQTYGDAESSVLAEYGDPKDVLMAFSADSKGTI